MRIPHQILEMPSGMAAAPLVAPALALTLGIAVGRYAGISVPIYVAAAVALIAITCLVYVRARSTDMLLAYRSRHLIWAAILPLSFVAGVLLITLRDNVRVPTQPYLEAIVRSSSTTTTGTRTEVDIVGGVEADGSLTSLPHTRCILYSEATAMETGDSILMKNMCTPIDGSSDYQYAKGIDFIANITPANIWHIGESDVWRYRALRLRSEWTDGIRSTQLQADTREFLCAFMLGDDSGMNSSVRRDFSLAGIAHLLALSGLHVGIIVLLLSVVLIWLDALGQRDLRYIITIIAVLMYAVLTGLEASVCRAVLMTVVLLGAAILQRPHSVINALSIAAIIILSADPRALFDAGFQLSFLCTLTVLTVIQTLQMSQQHRTYTRVLRAVSVPLAVFGVCWPLMAWHFHSVSMVFLPLNVLLLPLLPLFMGSALLYLGGYALGLNILPLAWATDSFYTLMRSATQWLASSEYAAIQMTVHHSVPIVGVVFALFLCRWLYTHTYRAMMMSIVSGVALLMTAIFTTSATQQQSISIPPLYDRTEIRLVGPTGEKHITLTDGAVSVVQAAGHKVVYVDAPLLDEVLTDSCDIAIIGPNSKQGLRRIADCCHPGLIVLSPRTDYVRHEREQERIEGQNSEVAKLQDAEIVIPL